MGNTSPDFGINAKPLQFPNRLFVVQLPPYACLVAKLTCKVAILISSNLLVPALISTYLLPSQTLKLFWVCTSVTHGQHIFLLVLQRMALPAANDIYFNNTMLNEESN